MLRNVFPRGSEWTSDEITSRLRNWLTSLFITAINRVSNYEDRLEIIRWLTLSREVVASDKSTKEKFVELYRLMDSRKTAQIVINSVVASVKNYKNSDLPLAVKICVPMTLLAAPFIGGQGAGIVAFGGGVGLPVLLLIFLGTAGLTSVIEAFAGNETSRAYLQVVLDLIARDEASRRIKAAIKNGSQGPPKEPVRSKMPDDELARSASWTRPFSKAMS